VKSYSSVTTSGGITSPADEPDPGVLSGEFQGNGAPPTRWDLGSNVHACIRGLLSVIVLLEFKSFPHQLRDCNWLMLIESDLMPKSECWLSEHLCLYCTNLALFF
jgi:hypothetical protein